ncbi:pyruvate dehydrogenase (acetyl-transferring) E1 component subunit alpha [Alicyclobacillus herbarius]|uniref:pyruvate dehydrogenase (acetyl-transferring) E1 component subunit alpha n=1 Tax=Alicyclobacillus herbarius TaxID=122960 RepID=UPI0012DD7DD4|nr:pyruvate dehydrogenase (acetyl-transferring) E1 component subunit alpha [Alicyclobacillus herbarius]
MRVRTASARFGPPLEGMMNVSYVIHPVAAADEPKPTGIDDALLVRMYEQMVWVRQFDRRLVALQRSGRIGTYPPVEGHEACQVASTLALRKQDWVFPTYRDTGAMLVHGVPMEQLLLYWNGRPEGLYIPEGVKVFPICVPIATQLPHAAGVAWAAQLRGLDEVALAFFGDGATSEGDFHEALNFAGVFRLPVIFLCENNQYAISVPYTRQTASETIAQKAEAYGVEGIRVDGGDAIAVYKAVKDALEKARQGGGATLIEALTYRYGPHTTSDDPSKYRSQEEAEAWRERDAIVRHRRRLENWGLWDDAQQKALEERVNQEIVSAIRAMEAAPPPNPDDLFEHVYKELTPQLRRQRDELRRRLAEREEANA